MSADLRGRLVPTVPEAGRLLLGLGRDASYAAAERGDLPTIKVGRRLICPTHQVLKATGMSDDLIAVALGLAPERSEAEPASPAIAQIRPLTKDSIGDQHASAG